MNDERDLFTEFMDDMSAAGFKQEIVEIVEPLRSELNLITSKGLREFVSLMLVNAPFIWTSPSTDQEDTHPPDEYDIGGLIKHIKRTTRAAFVLATVFPLSDDDVQILLAAAILHCIAKPLLPNDGVDPFVPQMYDNHYMVSIDVFIQEALIAELNAKRFTREFVELDQEIIDRIVRLIHCCEGTFSPIQEILPQDPIEMLMASANLVAKSVHLIVDGTDVKEDRWLL